MKKALLYITALFTVISCMKYGPIEEESFSADAPSGEALYIINEGNFMYGNASLSYYDAGKKSVENEVFARSNSQKLGDVAYTMTVHDNKGWIVVNNSGVIFAIDLNTFKEVGRITGLTSPRHILFISDTKAYVTQLWDPRIYIVNPKTFQITGYIETDMDYETGSTEMMIRHEGYLYVNCWSYQNRILKIDLRTDKVVDQLVVGIQPRSMVMDCNEKIWVMTDGGFEGSPYGYEPPCLHRIDAKSFAIETTFRFKLGDSARGLCTDSAGENLFWLDKEIWKMDVNASHLPLRPLIKDEGRLYYSMTVNPLNGDIYVSDAIDYVQNGIVYRYTAEGVPTDTISVGINPGSFCWR